MKTIFFIEDNALIVKVYQMALSREGFCVEVAEDGLVAMKKLAAAKSDLVVLDLMIPKLTGTDVIKYIRSTPALKSLPVIILSDASIADLAQEAIKIGAERVFLKSQCSPAILIGAIKELLGGGAPGASAQSPPA